VTPNGQDVRSFVAAFERGPGSPTPIWVAPSRVELPQGRLPLGVIPHPLTRNSLFRSQSMCWRFRPGPSPAQLPERVVCTMRGIDLGDRPAPQLPHRVLEVVSQDGEGSTHGRFTAGSQGRKRRLARPGPPWRLKPRPRPRHSPSGCRRPSACLGHWRIPPSPLANELTRWSVSP